MNFLALLWLALMFASMINGMQIESPREVAICISERIFDRYDPEVVETFNRILTKDRQTNTELVAERYRMLERLKALKKDSSSCSGSSSR